MTELDNWRPSGSQEKKVCTPNWPDCWNKYSPEMVSESLPDADPGEEEPYEPHHQIHDPQHEMNPETESQQHPIQPKRPENPDHSIPDNLSKLAFELMVAGSMKVLKDVSYDMYKRWNIGKPLPAAIYEKLTNFNPEQDYIGWRGETWQEIETRMGTRMDANQAAFEQRWGAAQDARFTQNRDFIDPKAEDIYTDPQQYELPGEDIYESGISGRQAYADAQAQFLSGGQQQVETGVGLPDPPTTDPMRNVIFGKKEEPGMRDAIFGKKEKPGMRDAIFGKKEEPGIRKAIFSHKSGDDLGDFKEDDPPVRGEDLGDEKEDFQDEYEGKEEYVGQDQRDQDYQDYMDDQADERAEDLAEEEDIFGGDPEIREEMENQGYFRQDAQEVESDRLANQSVADARAAEANNDLGANISEFRRMPPAAQERIDQAVANAIQGGETIDTTGLAAQEVEFLQRTNPSLFSEEFTGLDLAGEAMFAKANAVVMAAFVAVGVGNTVVRKMEALSRGDHNWHDPSGLWHENTWDKTWSPDKMIDSLTGANDMSKDPGSKEDYWLATGAWVKVGDVYTNLHNGKMVKSRDELPDIPGWDERNYTPDELKQRGIASHATVETADASDWFQTTPVHIADKNPANTFDELSQMYFPSKPGQLSSYDRRAWDEKKRGADGKKYIWGPWSKYWRKSQDLMNIWGKTWGKYTTELYDEPEGDELVNMEDTPWVAAGDTDATEAADMYYDATTDNIQGHGIYSKFKELYPGKAMQVEKNEEVQQAILKQKGISDRFDSFVDAINPAAWFGHWGRDWDPRTDEEIARDELRAHSHGLIIPYDREKDRHLVRQVAKGGPGEVWAKAVHEKGNPDMIPHTDDTTPDPEGPGIGGTGADKFSYQDAHPGGA